MLHIGSMSTTSTRAKLAGVALALKLKVPSIEPFVSDHYPLHSTPAQQASTARDASRRERNFLIGKSCESPRLKGVLFIKACSSNRLAQRWARARAGHVSCGSWGWSNGKQSFMLSQDGKVWETKDRARAKIDDRKVPGWGLPFPGWRRKRGRRSPKTAADGSPLRRLPRSMSIKAAGWFQIIRIRVFLA